MTIFHNFLGFFSSKIGTGTLDSKGREVCLGDYVRYEWGCASYDGVKKTIYRVHRIVLHENKFLLGNPDAKGACYNIWEDGDVEIVSSKYKNLCGDIDIDEDFKVLSVADIFKGFYERVNTRLKNISQE